MTPPYACLLDSPGPRSTRTYGGTATMFSEEHHREADRELRRRGAPSSGCCPGLTRRKSTWFSGPVDRTASNFVIEGKDARGCHLGEYIEAWGRHPATERLRGLPRALHQKTANGRWAGSTHRGRRAGQGHTALVKLRALSRPRRPARAPGRPRCRGPTGWPELEKPVEALSEDPDERGPRARRGRTEGAARRGVTLRQWV